MEVHQENFGQKTLGLQLKQAFTRLFFLRAEASRENY